MTLREPLRESARATAEIMELRQDVAQRILAEAAERDSQGHSEVVIALLFFAIFGAIMGSVITLTIQAIIWHWPF